MYNLDIDVAVKLINEIVDSIRCGVCDKIEGIRLRYSCGHTSCEDCAAAAVDCYLCLTPQSNFQEPVIDKPLTGRIENIVHLLNVFQDVFHIDVYKRQRLSEQLKIEKEVFPECIQAPVKYFNKRKSLQNSTNNKENILRQLPGEKIPSVWEPKMDHKNVEQWLNKYMRKPLTDLNTNVQKLRGDSSFTKNYHIALDSDNRQIKKLTRKRPHMKSPSFSDENQSKLDKKLLIKTKVKKIRKSIKKPKIEQNVKALSHPLKVYKDDNNTNKDSKDESGIVLDDVEAIIIDDSQSVGVDKDLAALKAVHEAEDNNNHDSATVISSKSQISLENMPKSNTELIYKVPFYLRGNLSNQINDCNSFNIGSNNQPMEQNKDISITIENKSFITTVQIKNSEETIKQSVEIQTDQIDQKEGIDNIDHDMEFVKDKSPVACNTHKYDVVKENNQEGLNASDFINKNNNMVKKSENVIIEESDSDEDLGDSISMSVAAEVHRSCEEIDYKILAAVDNLAEHGKRPRRAARGHTPASTDSSEKENFNPNRRKKAVGSKKKPMKK